ncbi:MAG: SDR family oxidoreductase [bacterium]
MKCVAVTGVAGYVGSRLTALLDADPDVEKVVGFDVKPPAEKPGKLAFYHRDINEPLEEILRENSVAALVHLAFAVNPLHDRAAMTRINIGGTKNVLGACRAAGVKRIVVAGSATAYGAHPDNPDFITEDQPLRGNPDFQYAREKVEVERLCAEYAAADPDVTMCLVRPSTIMGAGIENYIGRFVSRRLAFAVAGANPRMQFIHEDDAARAFHAVLKKGVSGAYNVAGDQPLTVDEINALAGRKPIRLPHWMVYPAVNLLWLVRLSDAPAPMVHFIRYPWVVSTEKIKRELGFSFRKTTKEAFVEFVEARLRKTASSGAPGRGGT